MTPNEIGLYNLRKMNESLAEKENPLVDEVSRQRRMRHQASFIRDFNPICRARRGLQPLDELIAEARGKGQL